MDYYEILFTIPASENYQQDLLINALGAIGFEGFEEIGFGFKGFIRTVDFDKTKLDKQLLPYRQMFSFSYDITFIPQKNWNEVWESNFEPIEIGKKIFVRATFHKPKPQFPFEIVIDPKMAFGTGHHQTTVMMLELMLESDFENKNVLDMGCGTGILAIMASRLGSSQITAIDNDPVCYASTIENAQLNKIENIRAHCGSVELIPNEQFDIILANINRNILLSQIGHYSKVLKSTGEIYLSGFYEMPDLQIIIDEAAKYSLKYAGHKEEKYWVAVKVVKKNIFQIC